MKTIALTAAALLLSSTAFAQTTTDQPAGVSPPPAGGNMSEDTSTDSGMADSGMASPTPSSDMSAQPTGASTATPTGGYQPTTPPLSGTPAAGQQVIFQPSPAPSVAFPPPAPMKEYPICKRGQTDDCMQRGG